MFNLYAVTPHPPIFKPRKTPESMDQTHDSYSRLEYTGFPNPPTVINSISRKCPIPSPSLRLTVPSQFNYWTRSSLFAETIPSALKHNITQPWLSGCTSELLSAPNGFSRGTTSTPRHSIGFSVGLKPSLTNQSFIPERCVGSFWRSQLENL